jgi:predicted esterase
MRALFVAAFSVTALTLLSASPADIERQDTPAVPRREASGQFQFIDPGTQHPIKVWFCRTAAIASDTRIVFIMHGSESQTVRQACDIASPYLQTHKALVLAPQFAEEFYPGDAYMFGNMVDSDGRLRPQSAWAFAAIEELFDRVRAELGLSHTQYDIVGFSGGAQFVHRLALFAPDARFRRAVVASAGRYALPSWAERFPYGLAGGPIERKMLPAVFARDLVLLLGDQDVTDRERDAASMAQGRTRLPEACGSLLPPPTKPRRWVCRSAGGFVWCPAWIIRPYRW